MNGEPGEILGIPFPYTNLETTKRRPIVLMTSPDRHGDIVTLAITSAPTAEHAVRITSDDLQQGVLPKTSWIRCDKIFTLNADIVTKRYGMLDAATQARVRTCFCRFIGCH